MLLLKIQAGFTLIEIIIFLVVTSIMISTLMLAFSTGLLKTPTLLNNFIADQTAKKCMEWFLSQRNLNGYTAITCPSTAVPSFCTAPAGYTLAVNISCTTINSDSNYQTITVTASGQGNTTLSTLIANY